MKNGEHRGFWLLAASYWLVEMVVVVASALVLAAPVMAGASPELRVVTTIKPLHSLVAAVMEGVGTPHLLVDGARSPHDFHMRPSDARALHAAGVVFRISPQIEPFLNKTVKNLPASVQLVTMINVEGLKLWNVRTGVTFEAHAHNHDVHEDHEDHDGHGAEGGSHHKDQDDTDGHVWLRPDNAKLLVKHIATVLAKRAPKHATVFQANAARVVAEIDALQKAIALRMIKLKDQRFIVFHDAFQYFERSFGLQAAGAISLRPDTPPGANRLTGLRQTIRDLHVTCAFSEPQFRAQVIDTVIENLDVRKGLLDPIGAALSPGPKLYGHLMLNLADGFEACLGKAS